MEIIAVIVCLAGAVVCGVLHNWTAMIWAIIAAFWAISSWYWRRKAEKK